MKITFLGVGSAFVLQNYHTMILIENEGKSILFDCGSDIRFALRDNHILPSQIDCIYLSHLHSDHIGGLEYIGFQNFYRYKRKVSLIGNATLLHNLWEHALKGGMGGLENDSITLDTFFDIIPMEQNNIVFSNIDIQSIPLIHILGKSPLISHGALLTNLVNHQQICITTDCVFSPDNYQQYLHANIIFQDCEFGFQSGVHCHYEQLKQFPSDIKKKMYLYNYDDVPLPDVTLEGFAGIVRQGDYYQF